MRASTTRIAWRNLWRNRRRTWLALAAIALSTAIVLLYNGVLRAYGAWMVDTVTGPMLGDVQVHAPGWRKDRALDRTVRGAAARVRAGAGRARRRGLLRDRGRRRAGGRGAPDGPARVDDRAAGGAARA